MLLAMETAPAHIRPGRTEDAPALARLCTELGYPSGEAQVRERLRRLDAADHGFFVAEAGGGGDLCGVVDVHERVVLEEDPFAELIALVVAGDARGEGIGSALVAEAVRWARARDLPKLWVRVSLWREGTPRFYESLGFRLYKEQRVFELRAVKRIVLGDCLDVLGSLDDGCARLVYLDPPFNTGKVQERTRTRAVRDDDAERVGFNGKRYRTEVLGCSAWNDAYDDYLGFLAPRLEQARRILADDGSLFFHIDPRESHYCKVLLDELFGRASFVNEIVWAYDYGARPRKRWPAKHDVILWYARDPARYVFRYDDIDRVPYLAPGLVGPEKAARGKTPTDVWWQTIVSPTGREKTGYPTQKPVRILERIVRVHSDPGDLVVDPFAGSGTTGEAAARLGREYLLVDENPEAVRVMRERLAWDGPEVVDGAGPAG